MRFSIENIDPNRAKAFLAKNTKNRPLVSRTVDNYASDMTRGVWVDTGDTIKISKSGALIDGQHRLEAVVKSGAAVTFAIAYDVPDTSFDSIDIGRVRKASDVVALRGHKNYTTVASASRLVYLDEHGFLDSSHPSLVSQSVKSRYITNRDVIQTIEAHPDIVECAQMSIGTYRFSGQLLTYGVAAFLLWKFRQIDRVCADRFFGALTDGLGLEANSPVFMLRERLVRNQADRRKMERRELYHVTVKAWNAERTNRSLSPSSLRLRTRGPSSENTLMPL